ncbi:MAG: Flp pilus assembly complex ATPase component TadA [Burkholderiales bacterium]|nr:Flp pilus assembly complex ATPase component TadA [Burkholderiales bacterium]
MTSRQGLGRRAGPPGSGTTATRCSRLQHEADADKHCVTIEDQVGSGLHRPGQALIHAKVGLTFRFEPRSILRRCPLVVTLGEILGVETAAVASHAALTGHPVFSVLHTHAGAAVMAQPARRGLPGLPSQRLPRPRRTP